jgi:hypothetical protein
LDIKIYATLPFNPELLLIWLDYPTSLITSFHEIYHSKTGSPSPLYTSERILRRTLQLRAVFTILRKRVLFDKHGIERKRKPIPSIPSLDSVVVTIRFFSGTSTKL